MNNNQDEIRHLKYLHMEYKKKYNSKRQSIEEENKTISETNSLNQLNNINNEINPKYFQKLNDKEKNYVVKYNETFENKDQSNKSNVNNTNNSLSEHIIGEAEKNKKIIARKSFPLHQINSPIDKEGIKESEENNNNEISKEATIELKNDNKDNKNEDKIRINLQIDKGMKR